VSQLYQFSIPLPPSELSPNGRHHWAAKNRAINGTGGRVGYKGEVFALAWKAKPVALNPKPIRITFDWYMGPMPGCDCYRPRDADNAVAAMKAAIDGIKMARWVPDDGHQWVKIGEPTLRRTKKDHQGRCEIMVTIEVLD